MTIKERAIFFGEDTIDVSKWKLKKLEDVTFGLLSDRPGLFAFINSDDVQGDHFTVEIGHEPGEAMFTYEATIVDEDTMPYLKHRPKSR